MKSKDSNIASAIEVEKRLIKNSIKKTGYIFWEMPLYDSQGKVLFSVDCSLKNGLAGIALFYLNLYKFTNSSKYLTRFDKVVRGIIKKNSENKTKHFGFWEGMSGTVYVLLRAYEATGSVYYLTTSKELILNSREFIFSQQVSNSLYSGRAGLLLLLLDLLNLTNDKPLEDLAHVVINLMLSQSNLSENSQSWYFDQTQSQDPVSWSFGSAGISYSLQRASEYFQSDGLTLCSKLAMNHCLNSNKFGINHWPNFLNPIESSKDDKVFIKKFKKNRRDLCRGKFTVNIENGLMGICLRNELNPKPNKKEKKLNDILRPVVKSFASKRGLNTQTDRHAFSFLFGKNSVASMKKVKHNQANRFSLYSGLAGEGFHYLLLSNVNLVTKYWIVSDLPYHPKKYNYNKDYYSRNAVISTVILPKFYRTFSMLKSFNSIESESIHWGGNFKSPNNLLKPFKELVVKAEHSAVRALFDYEYSKFLLCFKNQTSPAEIFCEKYISFLENRQLQKLSFDQILSKRYKLNPLVKILSSKWDILSWSGTMTPIVKGNFKLLFLPTDQREKYFESGLNDLERLICYMKTPISGQELLNAIKQQYGIKSRVEAKNIKSKLVNLILSKVQENVLIIV
jgi:hypothetical protein